jgi:hypothetical protein
MTTTSPDLFTAAFQPAAEKITADFVRYVTNVFNRISQDDVFGPSLNCRNAYHRDAAALRFIRAFTEEIPGANGHLSYRPAAPKRLRAEYLAKCARDYADAQIASFVAKLVKKLEGLDVAEVINQSGLTFVIKGSLNGHAVLVEQTQVFKVSSKGTPFNQWPARIYVDGKFTPEAKFLAVAA